MVLIKRLGYATAILFIVLSFHLAAKTKSVITLDDAKAHYIIEVMKHITWPNEDQITHFSIAILGKNKELFHSLNNKVSNKILGKSITIHQLKNLNNAQNSYEIIVVHKTKFSLIPAIIKKHKNTLIISDGTTDRQNIMVGLFSFKKHIKLTINRENLIAHGFKVSNGLLDFAGTKNDLKEQLKDKEKTLKKLLQDVELKEEELKESNILLVKNRSELAKIQFDLKKQSSQLSNVQTQFHSLRNDKSSIEFELAENKSNLLKQQQLITDKEAEHQQQQQKLFQLNLDIAQSEKKLKQQVIKLKKQSNIIDLKEEKITGQRKLLYITIAAALIILILKFVVLRTNRIRKKTNKELASLNEQLYELATTDDMTKLFNRRHFLELAQRGLNQIQRTSSMGAVLMIDIDHFKKINDSYGHAAGDRVLIEVANILKDNLRNYDIVGRVGGEEFAMLLPNSDIDTATRIAERIREKIANSSTPFQQTAIKLTISIGLTAIHEDEINIDSIIKRADKALYKAKNSGRNTVTLL